MKYLFFASLILLSSCAINLEKIKSEPTKWVVSPVIVMDWDGQQPVDRWIYTFELDRVDTSYNNVPFVLREVTITQGDTLKKVYILETSFTETYKLINN